MTDPIQVYLDTSDVWRFAKVTGESTGDEPKWVGDTRSFLIEEVKKGLIEIRFSAIHILEILDFDEAHLAQATARARELKNLCGNKVFRQYPDVLEYELKCFCLSKSRNKTWPRRDDGRWFSAPRGIIGNTLEQAINEIENLVDNVPASRQLKRQAKRRLVRNGQLMPLAEELIRANRDKDELAKFRQQFPISDKFYDDDFLLGLLTGRKSQEEVEAAMIDGILDPENLIGSYSRRQDVRDLPGSKSKFGADVVEIIKATKRMTDEIIEGNLKVDVSRQRQRMLDRWATVYQNRKWMDRERLLTAEHGDIPTIDIFCDIIAGYLRAHTGTNPAVRKPKYSDGGDILHALYAPYCDIWRCDVGAAPFIAPHAKRLGVTPVDKLENLADVIRNRVTR